jgi:ATP-dependent protease HslVU (ClpYQ) peptidase subunit
MNQTIQSLEETAKVANWREADRPAIRDASAVGGGELTHAASSTPTPPASATAQATLSLREHKECLMTVCIAAACNNGDQIVTATDGRLSAGDVTADTIPGKMHWIGEWLFMYAGVPGYFALIMEEIAAMAVDNAEGLSRRRIQETVLTAYRRVVARISSRETLDPFDLTIEAFKKTGLEYFGEAFHAELARTISQKASQVNEQLLITGWGHAPHSVMIYEVGPTVECLHTSAGFAAIGSGANMAQTMLLSLGQARHLTLSETIFNVACAKFSSEKSADFGVGPTTTMFVSRKRSQEDSSHVCGEFLEDKEIGNLRALWEEHLKPRIPDEARSVIQQIAARLNHGKNPVRDMVERLNAESRLAQKRAKPEDSVDLE